MLRDLATRAQPGHRFAQGAAAWANLGRNGDGCAYEAEFVFPRAVIGSRIHTEDPAEADFFLVPHFTTAVREPPSTSTQILPLSFAIAGRLTLCVAAIFAFSLPLSPQVFHYWHWRHWDDPGVAVRRCNEHFEGIMRYVAEAHPHWNATGGADKHVFVWSHDHGPRLMFSDGKGYPAIPSADVVSYVSSAGAVAALREARRARWLVHAAMPGRRAFGDQRPGSFPDVYDPARDVAILNPMPRTNPIWDDEGVPEFKNKKRKRHPSVVWRGGCRDNPARQALADAYAGDRRVLIACGHAETYMAELWAADFCVHLAGFGGTWSGRLAVLLRLHCVPVLVIDAMDWPAQEVIPWERFTVRLSYARVLAGGLRALAKLPRRAVDAMRVAKAAIAHRLRYNEVAMWRDATHSAFEALARKVAGGGPRAVPAEWPPALLALLEAEAEEDESGGFDAIEFD